VTLLPRGSVDNAVELWARRHVYRRYLFRVARDSEPPETWEHVELTPFGGGAPIRFAFSWVPLNEARLALGYGFADHLDAVLR
jgi:hypothetical protein